MSRRFAVLVAVTLSVGVGLGASSSIAAADTGGNNVAVVQTNASNQIATRAAVKVSHDPGDVNNQNVAIAKSSSCTGCHTVAVAMQVIVEEGNPATVAPTNAAVAANGSCTSCTTYAFAYQYLLTPHQVVYLSAAAQQQIADINRQVDSTTASALSYQDMAVQLNGLFNQLVQTVNQNLQTAGIPANGTISENAQAA